VRSYPVEQYAGSLARAPAGHVPTLEQIGFERGNLRELHLPTGTSGGRTWLRDFLSRIDRYHEQRNYPALKDPSYLSVHLRFGTLSIRELAVAAWTRGGPGAQNWLSELIWREFYFMILHHHPRVVNHAFRAEFDSIAWRDCGVLIGRDYPPPIVDHADARKATLELYAKAKG
jgi:deoxyribodipyrimidine photo-lyase